MKTIYLAAVLLIFPLFTFSQNSHGSFNIASHDSLVFDGGYSYTSGECGCSLKILRFGGVVYGTVCERHFSNVCGVVDTVYKTHKGLLMSDEKEVLDVDSILTGDFEDSYIDLKFDDGKKMHL